MKKNLYISYGAIGLVIVLLFFLASVVMEKLQSSNGQGNRQTTITRLDLGVEKPGFFTRLIRPVYRLVFKRAPLEKAGDFYSDTLEILVGIQESNIELAKTKDPQKIAALNKDLQKNLQKLRKKQQQIRKLIPKIKQVKAKKPKEVEELAVFYRSKKADVEELLRNIFTNPNFAQKNKPLLVKSSDAISRQIEEVQQIAGIEPITLPLFPAIPLVTSPPVNRREVSMYEERIVWNEMPRVGESDVYLYDIASGKETALVVTEDVYEHSPDIYKNYVVWSDARSGDTDIYLLDLDTGKETQITTDPKTQLNPAIWGNYIVWEDYRIRNETQIYLYDLTTGEEKRITSDSSSRSIVPDIYGDYIVWTDLSYPESCGGRTLYSIYYYHIPTGAVNSIPKKARTEEKGCFFSEKGPSIYETYIAFQRGFPSSKASFENVEISLYDITNGKETSIANTYANTGGVNIQGNNVVWHDSGGGKKGVTDVYVYDISTSETKKITDQQYYYWAGAVYDDKVVWLRDETGKARVYSIYMTDLSPPPFSSQITYPFGGHCTDGQSDLLVRLGAKWGRYPLRWQDVQPQPNKWELETIEKQADQYLAEGLLIAPNLKAGQLSWATTCPSEAVYSQASCPPKDYEAYYAMVFQLAKQLKGKVDYFIIENEASSHFWAGTQDEYLKLRETAYRAIHDANPQGKVIDNGFASLAWGGVVAKDIYESGQTQAAIDFLNGYMRNRKRKKITTEAQLKQAIYETPHADFVEASFANGNSFDIASVHFYEPSDYLDEIITWVKKEMKENGYDKPIWITELGAQDQLDTISYEEAARELVKKYVTAMGMEVDTSIWFRAIETCAPDALSEVDEALYDEQKNLLPAGEAYKYLVAKIADAESRKKINTGNDKVIGYHFTMPKETIAVLWSATDEAQQISLSDFGDIRGAIFTDKYGKVITIPPTNTIFSVTSDPIFIIRKR